jgi:hypothetical protein
MFVLNIDVVLKVVSRKDTIKNIANVMGVILKHVKSDL